MKKVVAFAAAVALLVSAWLIYSKAAQIRREAHYRAAIAPFQRDLHAGMTRAEVEKYLDSRSVKYYVVSFDQGTESNETTYETKIGEEPGNLACEPWQVYMALEFNSSNALSEVHIRKIGTCL